MASPSCPVRRRLEAAEPQLPLLSLSDDLLEEIFLRVGSPADLACASTACVAFRRLIADPTFLRRYRSLHSPLFLGVLYHGYGSYIYHFQAVDTAAHPNAAALASAADFSFSYIPPHRRRHWDPCDVRDGRVLLAHGGGYNAGFPNLAVCDPLSREYVLLPAIPDGLLASVQLQERDLEDLEVSFMPSADTEETPFKVMFSARAHSVTVSLVLVFSSGSGCWSICTCTSRDSLSLSVSSGDTSLSSPQGQWAYHCCYWKVFRKNKLLKLDTERMEFSTVDLPPDHNDVQCVIVEAEEGKIAMFSYNFSGTSVGYYAFLQNEGVKAYAWHLKNTIVIPLPACFWCNINDAAAEGYILIVGTLGYDSGYSLVFSLDIKTFIVEEFGRIKNPYHSIYPYFGFPPSMSPRRVYTRI